MEIYPYLKPITDGDGNIIDYIQSSKIFSYGTRDVTAIKTIINDFYKEYTWNLLDPSVVCFGFDYSTDCSKTNNNVGYKVAGFYKDRNFRNFSNNVRLTHMIVYKIIGTEDEYPIVDNEILFVNEELSRDCIINNYVVKLGAIKGIAFREADRFDFSAYDEEEE